MKIYDIMMIKTVTAHDLLIFDEFEYSFNLLDSSDWDEHELSHDYSVDLDKNIDINPFQRRLMNEFEFYYQNLHHKYS